MSSYFKSKTILKKMTKSLNKKGRLEKALKTAIVIPNFKVLGSEIKYNKSKKK